MLFNFTDNYKFTTRLEMNRENLEVVIQATLFGVIITNDLKWDKNTEYLVKKANSRMQLLRKVAEFASSIEDKKNIYVLYVRSIMEQSSVVWQENAEDLERVQKAALRIIIGKECMNYDDALLKADMESLEDRREKLCKNFAEKSIKSGNIRANNMFKE